MSERTERLKLTTPIKAHHTCQVGFDKLDDDMQDWLLERSQQTF